MLLILRFLYSIFHYIYFFLTKYSLHSFSFVNLFPVLEGGDVYLVKHSVEGWQCISNQGVSLRYPSEFSISFFTTFISYLLAAVFIPFLSFFYFIFTFLCTHILITKLQSLFFFPFFYFIFIFPYIHVLINKIRISSFLSSFIYSLIHFFISSFLFLLLFYFFLYFVSLINCIIQ